MFIGRYFESTRHTPLAEIVPSGAVIATLGFSLLITGVSQVCDLIYWGIGACENASNGKSSKLSCIPVPKYRKKSSSFFNAIESV